MKREDMKTYTPDCRWLLQHVTDLLQSLHRHWKRLWPWNGQYNWWRRCRCLCRRRCWHFFYLLLSAGTKIQRTHSKKCLPKVTRITSLLRFWLRRGNRLRLRSCSSRKRTKGKERRMKCSILIPTFLGRFCLL
jgi:hypothetical protein